MFRKYIFIMVAILFFSMVSFGCSPQENAASSTTTYTKVSDSLYVDDTTVQISKEQQRDAEKIKKQVESYVLRVLYSSYNGRIGTIDGDFISSPGLEAEMDARIVYIAQKYDDEDFSNTSAYLKYEIFDIQNDTAKVIVSVYMKNPSTGDIKAENHEGYVFVKDENNWFLINDIVDTGQGGATVLNALAKNTDPEEWKTAYSYENLKRSDYETGHDFRYFMNNDGSMSVDPEKIKSEN